MGSASRFTRRGTDPQPTKSGIVGLLAAAEGRRREDPIEDLSGLRLGVRVERPGVLIGDFQTARRPLRGGGSGDVSMPLSTRYYLSDAVFLAAIEGPEPLIRGLEEATRRPRFALALGRRSCPTAGQFLLGVAGGSLEEALSAHSWLGRPVRTSRAWQPPERLLVVRDLGVDEDLTGAEREHDVPLSFDPGSGSSVGGGSVVSGSTTRSFPPRQTHRRHVMTRSLRWVDVHSEGHPQPATSGSQAPPFVASAHARGSALGVLSRRTRPP